MVTMAVSVITPARKLRRIRTHPRWWAWCTRRSRTGGDFSQNLHFTVALLLTRRGPLADFLLAVDNPVPRRHMASPNRPHSSQRPWSAPGCHYHPE